MENVSLKVLEFFVQKKGTDPGINFGRIWHDIKSYMEPKR